MGRAVRFPGRSIGRTIPTQYIAGQGPTYCVILMRHLFWQQRGPLAVVHDLRDQLRAGESVVFLAPRWSPDVVEPLSASMPERPVVVIDASAPGGLPEKVLCAELGLADGQHAASCGEPGLEPIGLVRSATGASLNAWVSFVVTHYHGTRFTPRAARLML